MDAPLAVPEADPVSVVMVAFNEARTIEAEVRQFHDAIVRRLPGSEFIVAEDGSTDGTTQILQSLAATLGIVHVTGPQRKGYKRAFPRGRPLDSQPLRVFLPTREESTIHKNSGSFTLCGASTI